MRAIQGVLLIASFVQRNGWIFWILGNFARKNMHMKIDKVSF